MSNNIVFQNIYLINCVSGAAHSTYGAGSLDTRCPAMTGSSIYSAIDELQCVCAQVCQSECLITAFTRQYFYNNTYLIIATWVWSGAVETANDIEDVWTLPFDTDYSRELVNLLLQEITNKENEVERWVESTRRISWLALQTFLQFTLFNRLNLRGLADDSVEVS